MCVALEDIASMAQRGACMAYIHSTWYIRTSHCASLYQVIRTILCDEVYVLYSKGESYGEFTACMYILYIRM